MTTTRRPVHPANLQPSALAAEIRTRIASGDLQGFTVQQLTRAAEHYELQAADVEGQRERPSLRQASREWQ